MIVILAEKPSVARDIAAHLGASRRCEGYFEGNGYQVTWAFGHLIALKEPDEYDPILKKWSLHTLPFIPSKFELKIGSDKGVRKQFGIIKKLFKSSSEIICATDAGREGELIFRYILTMAECTRKPWRRLWLSSLTEEALKTAFKNLKQGTDYDPLYAAAKCRNEADWIVGLNATRNFTVRYGGGTTLWSVGRVQTPVLALIVNRDDEIRYFKSQPFWELCTKYRNTIFKYKGDRFMDQKEAAALLQTIQDHPFTIGKVLKKKENEHPPLLFDLTELQREMNRKLGLTAADTLQAAQALYEQKLITYPRTDSRYLSSDMQAQTVEVLQQLKKIKAKEIEPLNLSALPFSNRILNDKKVSDHHAIIPTGKYTTLTGPAQALYDAIVTRFIAVFYPACLKELTTIEAITNQVPFHAKGIRILNPGWTELYPKKTEDQLLPLFTQGESGPHAPYIEEGKTKPPAPFNENSLLGAMETAGKLVEDENLKEALKEKGLGTPATRASIIETLIKRKYIQRDKKSLRATDFGRYLIALIQDPNLKSPEMTGEWESKLKEIEKGKYSPTTFMENIAQFTRQLIAEKKINPSIYGPCPKCKNPIIKGTRGYGCSKWREGCKFVLFDLDEEQIRSLLQKQFLLQQSSILTLSPEGTLLETPLPTSPNKPDKPPSRRKRTPRKPT